MWDPFSWSLSLGRVRGINVRVHITFFIVVLGFIFRTALKKDAYPYPYTWVDATWLMGLLFLAVLLHEFGHCIAARLVDGDAHQILLWPLGGLASVDVPHTPRANFIATAGGPAVNLILCLATLPIFMFLADMRPPLNPLPATELGGWYPFRINEKGWVDLYNWQGDLVKEHRLWVILLARFFWLNWFLLLLNVVLIGFPMDGGRLVQCALWPRYGFRQSMLTAIFLGFVVAVILAIFAIVLQDVLLFCLAGFVFISCRQQYILLETGGEDSQFGDFSQGYTSLEREQPPPPRRRRQNFWQRWKQQRAALRLKREQELRVAEEQRMDELLEKVQRQGQGSLTEEEMRFLKRVSHKYRNRQ